MKIQLGRVVRRVCTRCDFSIEGDTEDRACPRCGGGLVEIRGEVDELIGQTLAGRFEIRDRLGAGGMGTVYRAWQPSVSREVAIKVMSRGFADDPMAVTRFDREAQLASRLSQPNTVSVFDSGKTEDGRPFIAMELIRGRTLLARIQQDGAFPAARIVRIGAQICDALDAAHALGIVHRDLKLENVIVLDDPPGRDLVKVLDFGLAKSVDDTRNTAAGVIVGTPRYMAPETAMEAAMSPAVDLYALGVILAELALGRPLWDGDNLGELLQHKLNPRPSIAPVPMPLRSLVGALIDPDPARRPDAAGARALLTGAGEPQAISSPEPSAPATVQLKPARRDALPAVAAPAAAGPPAPVAPAAPVPPRSARLAIAIGAGACAIAVAIVWVATRGRGSSKDAPPPVNGSTSASSGAADPWQPDERGHVAPAALAKAASDTVVLHVRSAPDPATISVSATSYGATPVDVTVARSRNAISVFADRGGESVHRDVVPDRDQDVAFDFAADTRHPSGPVAQLHVTSTPPGGRIVIDGDTYGHTPNQFVFSRGTSPIWIDVWFARDLGGSRQVTPDRDQTIDLDIEPACADRVANAGAALCLLRFCSGHRKDQACRR